MEIIPAFHNDRSTARFAGARASTFIDRIINRVPFYRSNPPAKQKISDEDGFSTADLRDFFDELRTS